MPTKASSTSSELDDRSLRAAGIEPGPVRISIGYTGDLATRKAPLEDELRRLGMIPR